MSEEQKLIFDMIQLFEAWKKGMFKDLGVEWSFDPPAIQNAKDYFRQHMPPEYKK